MTLRYICSTPPTYQVVRSEEELQHNDEPDENRLAAHEPKAPVHVLLVHEVPKDKEHENEVDLHNVYV